MAHQPSSGLDHPGLKTSQRPVLHHLRQGQPFHGVTQVVSQYEQLQPDLVGNELVAGKPGPGQGVFAFFVPLLRRTSAIVETDYPNRRIAQVGDDETYCGKQFSLVPLHLGHHSSGNIPTVGLVSEIVIGDDGLSGRPLSRPYQQVRDFSLKYRVS